MEQRLIDANKVNLFDIFGGISDFAQDCRNAVVGLLDIQPTLDPVHAAGACYCRECKHLSEKHYEDIGEKPYIKYSCNIFKRQMQSKDFCSYGEIRKVDPGEIRLLDKPDTLPRRREETDAAQEKIQPGEVLSAIARSLYSRKFCPKIYYKKDGCGVHKNCVPCIMDWLTEATPWGSAVTK